ncbi:hypothetical protein [Haloarcula onubensis]|uniref:Restriction endonuclease n=1 Tax=Haloarcula onubensis TaxID=2950539 RepID=A0ABU2FTI3_9EURY|nr:hypothetical protein [Halomicroarcula sp. S3CR25-11]MDS0284060.1 hypothetical protein [Halomicroarcula sp. S3CR25-11]
MSYHLYQARNFEPQGTEYYEKEDLPTENQAVFDDLDIPYRIKSTLIGEDTDSGNLTQVKFATMNLYPSDKDTNPNAPRTCYENDIIGVGWGGAISEDEAASVGAPEFTRQVFEKYGGGSNFHENDFAHFALWLSPGDIVITKNIGPVASYARVTGPIQHRSQSDFSEELEAHEIGFYRPVEWIDVRPKDAPSKVLSTACRGTLSIPTLDRISMEQVVDQFESPIGDIDRATDIETARSVFSNLSDEPAAPKKSNANRLIDSLSASGSHNGLETVVCTYIQEQTGAVMHPSSHSYPSIEAIFRKTNDETPETFGVQVKRGGFGDSRDNLKQFAKGHEKLFLFSSSGDKIDGDNIVNISASDLSDYMCSSPFDLPPVEIDRLLRTYDYLNN